MSTESHLFGQACALLCAVSWAFALVFFKQSGDRVPPLALNLFKNTVGLTLLAVSIAALLVVEGKSPATLFDYEAWHFGALLVSGIVGLGIADPLFFRALNLLGVGLVVIVDCVYTPFVAITAFFLLDEALLWPHYLGAVLVVTSVVLVAGRIRTPDRTPRQIAQGVALAVAAMALMAVAITAIKPTLEVFPTLWAVALRLVGGNAVLLAFAFWGPAWRENWRVFHDVRLWKHALPGAILGTYVSLILWVAGFKYTDATVAAVLNQTSVVFASILGAVMLREPFGGRKLAALAMAAVGVLFVTLARSLTGAPPN